METYQTAGVIGVEDNDGHAESDREHAIRTSEYPHHGKCFSKATLADTNKAFADAWAKTRKQK